MSNCLFHASFSFTLSAVILHMGDLPVQYAFVASTLSIMMDLDRTISPSPRSEGFLHSSWALSGGIVLAFILTMLSVPVPMAIIPFLAVLSHMFQDALHGESAFQGPLSRGFDPHRTFRPHLARWIDIASIPLGTLLALI
jgi:hypothetical protein